MNIRYALLTASLAFLAGCSSPEPLVSYHPGLPAAYSGPWEAHCGPFWGYGKTPEEAIGHLRAVTSHCEGEPHVRP